MRLMLRAAPLLLSILAVACGSNSAAPTPTPTPTPSGPPSVLEHHAGGRRNGLYVMPTLTRTAAASLSVDPAFAGIVKGDVYAQPLYVPNGPGGHGTFFVATENDEVDALDEATGALVWSRALGTPAGRTGAGCGNISPLGITGTPAIDLTRRNLYLSAATGDGNGIQHQLVHALSLDDGSERSGWPFDVANISFNGVRFDKVLQNQRGALTIVDGVLYVPFGGHAGDCGDYHGWVIAIPLDTPSAATGWATGATGGGIWAPGGLANDGTSIYAATGNTFGADVWSGGEAVVRLQKGAVFPGTPADYFAPSNWKNLDDFDVDIGGSGPVVFDVPGATPSTLVAALGKNGVVYLLDRTNLGGLGHGDGQHNEGLFSAHEANGLIINAAAVYTTPAGVHLVFHGYQHAFGSHCPAGQAGDVVSLLITASAPPTAITEWCADNHGQGQPIVTTTDGTSETIVWSFAAEGSGRLHGWNGETGALVYAGGGSGDVMQGLRRFGTPIAVNGGIFVAADNRLYAFRPH